MSKKEASLSFMGFPDDINSTIPKVVPRFGSSEYPAWRYALVLRTVKATPGGTEALPSASIKD